MRIRTRTLRSGAALRTVMLFIVAVVSLVAGGTGTAAAPPPAGATATMGIPDCVGTPRVRPVSITLACGDGGLIANGLTWTGWGGAFAAGRGTASANDCTPNCASGHYHTLPIVLIADGRERCPDGRAAYAKLTVAWPAPTEKSDSLTVPTPCGHP